MRRPSSRHQHWRRWLRIRRSSGHTNEPAGWDFVYWLRLNTQARAWPEETRKRKLWTSKYGATFLDLGIELEKWPREVYIGCSDRSCLTHNVACGVFARELYAPAAMTTTRRESGCRPRRIGIQIMTDWAEALAAENKCLIDVWLAKFRANWIIIR